MDAYANTYPAMRELVHGVSRHVAESGSKTEKATS